METLPAITLSNNSVMFKDASYPRHGPREVTVAGRARPKPYFAE